MKWINENSPPTLSYYGNSDRVIPSSQEKILDSVLNKNISSMSLIHSMADIWPFRDKHPNDQFLINKIETFLKKTDIK